MGRLGKKAKKYDRVNKIISDIALVNSGNFIARGDSIQWVPEVKEAIAEAYPDKSVEDSIAELGLSQEILVDYRLRSLKQYCMEQAAENVKTATGKHMSEECRDLYDEEIDRYREHPYVKKVTGSKSLAMQETFYNETFHLKEVSTEELLKMYEIDTSLLCRSSIYKIKKDRQEWHRTNDMQALNSAQTIRIQIRRLGKLEEHVSAQFVQIQQSVQSLGPANKKIICRQLSEYPTSSNYPYGFSLRQILDNVGISKTTYYKALSSKSYGMADELRRECDERDLNILLEVVNYKDFEKGIRQIYMMMPDITGEQFSISKIRRLLRKAGIKTKVRDRNPSRQSSKEFHKRNTKPNLLKREFRLHRPNEVRLTDVTYLDYGHTSDGKKKRAYGSSCIDPVTGKLLVFNISENNDVDLAIETLEKLSEHPTVLGALLHSDQGILYLTDEFQNKVRKMGMVQSMSKRGNCWDNAPQESFFGHFKDECSYESCETFEELKAVIDDYAYYYNNERHQWSRNKMTPVRYEAYMEAMTDEEFAKYMETEREKYVKMKERAEKKAIAKAKTLGV